MLAANMPECTPSTKASVEDSEIREKEKKFTVYKVAISSDNDSWFVFRRYNEFYKLFDILRKQIPGLQLKLPGKKLFGNNLDPQFIASRQEGLDMFLQQLMQDKKLLEIPEVRAFLQLDRPKLSSDGDGELEDTTEGVDVCEKLNQLNLGPSERLYAKPRDFEFLRVIGKGSYGKVLLARHCSEGQYYAIKILSKRVILRKNEVRHVMAERDILLKNVHHPFLVGLHYSFQTADKLYFVLDYVNGGELFFHLQRERTFPESRARFYAGEISLALGYLHSLNIVYRDLKPENILLDAQGHIVLTDFGLSKEVGDLMGVETTHTFCGTPEYLAPEIIRKEPYGRAVDWWCLGAVLYEMLYGLPPFYSRNTSEMYERILNKPLTLRSGTSESAKDLLSQLLEKDPRMRLGYAEGDLDTLKMHSFFSQINWDDLFAKKVRPPFNPNVHEVFDLRHIDPEFTREAVSSSVARSHSTTSILTASVREADDIFAGFSYAAPMDL